MAEIGPTSHIYISSRLRLHYVDWGNADAPTLILVHGGLDHCRNWDWVARHLCKDWHVLAPDLRGHGDSEWVNDGRYTMDAFTADLAQLVYQKGGAEVALVGHSLGGAIVARYAAIYPERVRKLVVIEGLGLSPEAQAKRDAIPLAERMRENHERRRAAAGRVPRHYATLDDALARMRQENPNLSAAQTLHLTTHGVNQNEDGSYSWKFDNYARIEGALDLPQEEMYQMWGRIRCPTLLLYGADSWASNPERDGRAAHFHNARVVEYARAGHWLHHDRFDDFAADVAAFLSE